ncbi:hypothetical protein C2E23DRAFT_729909 [Lenzites betulinus]|nr:hypothetical protein C2E23DRAFT_729909 [Lenzites betulinus]
MDYITARPRLSHDIFLELLNRFVRQAEVVALMGTCHTLWSAGLKVLFNDGVVIKTPSALRSFCLFMLNDTAARAPYVRRLHLKIPLARPLTSDDEDDMDAAPGNELASLSKDLVSTFALVLANLPNLKDLSIDYLEGLVTRDDDESFAMAIVTLGGLRRFHLGDSQTDEVILEIMSAMTAPLVELDLYYQVDPGADLYERSRSVYSVNQLAKAHADTLEKLSVRHGLLIGSGGDPDEEEEVATFPNVHTLTLYDTDNVDLLLVLHQAFPVLQSLEASAPMDTAIDAYEEMRQENETEAFDHPWGVLDRLCGDVNTLYGLGGAPPAKLLEVYRIYSDSTILGRLRTVIGGASPTHLVLHTGKPYTSPRLSARDISHLLPREEMEITDLVLNTTASTLKGTVTDFTNALATLMRIHSLKFLTLRFLKREVFDQDEAVDPSGLWAEDANGGVHSNHNEISHALGQSKTHFESIVHPLFRENPALVHVVLEIEGEDLKHWKIKRGNGGRLTQ